MGEDCSVFVLDMGDPVSILSLAKQMIYLSGHHLKFGESKEDGSGIEIKCTGLQKGEKKEELFIGANITGTEHPMIMKAQEESCEWSDIEKMLIGLESQQGLDVDNLRLLLMQYAMKKKDDEIV